MVYVNESLCTGCGECVPLCPSAAIQVLDGLAHIDQALCQECEACVSACPSRAILVVQETEPAKQPILVQDSALVLNGAPLAVAAPPRTGLWPAVGAALAFVGREIVPRVAQALLDGWDRRQAIQGTLSSSRKDVMGSGRSPHGGGQRRRWRGGSS